MLGLTKYPVGKNVVRAYSGNPFDSDNESDEKPTCKPSSTSSSEPTRCTITSISSTNPFDDVDDVSTSDAPSVCYHTSSAENSCRNDFRDAGGLENQSVQDLENYAVQKAEETTKTVNSCLKLAEEMREDATKTLVTLHQQGEQITRTHTVAANIDNDLSMAEKLLGSLGGIFSKTWKPKKGRSIMGPHITGEGSFSQLEQRERLGLTPLKRRSSLQTPSPEPTHALQKVEVETAKQDDALSDLSNLLGELKNMAVDMGSEIERQNKALVRFQDDVDELNFRVRGANQRGRRLLK